MAKGKVEVVMQEVHFRKVTLEVDDVEDTDDIIRRVNDGEGSEDAETEYYYTMDSSDWRINVVEEGS